MTLFPTSIILHLEGFLRIYHSGGNLTPDDITFLEHLGIFFAKTCGIDEAMIAHAVLMLSRISEGENSNEALVLD